MKYDPGDGKWSLSDNAKELRKATKDWPPTVYEEQKAAIKSFLCAYFSADGDCRSGIHKSIAPVGLTPNGGKILKMRWVIPGGGKRGG